MLLPSRTWLSSSLPMLASAASLCVGCSLDGLASGGAGGGGTQASSSGSSSASSSGSGGDGGAGGGVQSPFAWLVSIGNRGVQGTSPYAGDPGSGSSLRMSNPGPSGDVWLAVSTRGALTPLGGSGGGAGGSGGGNGTLGNPDTANLFFAHVDGAGEIDVLGSVPGSLMDVAGNLSVGGVLRTDDGGFVMVGSFFGGSLDFSPLGSITQNSLSQDDAFVARFDPSGVPLSLRHLTSGNHQTLRALTLTPGGALLVGGRFKRTLTVQNESGTADVACAYSVPSENFERAMILSLDPSTLACSKLTSFEAIDDNATQQIRSLVSNASGVVAAGTFARQIGFSGVTLLTSSANDDGFVIKLAPDLSSQLFAAQVSSNRFSANDAVRPVALAPGGLFIGGSYERGTSAVMGAEPAVGTTLESCILPLPAERDGFVALLDPDTGACLGAERLGSLGADEVRAIAVDASGVGWVAGFYSGSVGTLSSVNGGRDGFMIAVEPSVPGSLTLTSIGFGGASWDYADSIAATEGGVLVAGSFGLPFYQLVGDQDFFVGKYRSR